MPESESQQSWQKALANYFEREYANNPLPARERLSKAEEFQCRVIGGTFIQWKREFAPRLLQEREILRESFGVGSDPVLVFISNIPGLIAASQIIGPKKSSIFYLSQPAYESFLAQHPDENFCWHIKYTTHLVRNLDAEDLSRASAAYTLQDCEEFWLHHEETVLAELFVRGGDHLWKWDGNDVTLLEEGFNMWVS